MHAVTVIIPTWNRATTLGRAIDSALSQTWRPSEILVCDDGSTDESEQIVRLYRNAPVRWLPGPRGGRPAIPRNRGLGAARGEWLAFLDSDDTWHPQKLEMQLKAMESSGLRASCTAAARIFADKRVNSVIGLHNSSSISFSEIITQNKIVCSTVIVHRDILKTSGVFTETPELKVGEDYSLWLRVATQSKFSYVNQVLVNYLDDELNSVRNDAPDGWTQRQNVLEDVIAWSQHANVPEAVVHRLKWERNVARLRRRVWPLARQIKSLAGLHQK